MTPRRDQLWYKEAILYELRVRSFYDSDADGIGDLHGLGEKLDYLQDLGVTTLWLLPFYPSPLRDDGYDISDYTNVHPEAGTLRDFKHVLKEAHRRGLRVVTELVLNHTSDQHPWFQRARKAPRGSAARSFYVWSDSPDRYKDARTIFKDFESSNWAWDSVAQAYYWHRFYAHQPDLNYEDPQVRKAILHAVDFWLSLGVDGLRLDAVPYLFEREGTSCENLPEGHAFLKELRRHVDRRYTDRMLLAEANQWPEDAAAYFGGGDECHMAFHFPIMPRLFMAIQMEDRFPIVDILQQTPEIPASAQWALFLRNHDELTLEMVTDEERDYMYRAYATERSARLNLGIRRRLAPLLGNDRNKIELMNALLFSLPGTPVIYYGDEIGMGDNFYLGDRNGVRTPMQWSGDRNAGFSRANPHRLYLPVIIDPEYHYETVNVETQQKNPHSLLWWMKRLIGLRKRYRAFGRGSLEFLSPSNHKVLVFLRRFEDEQVLVVCNLSRFCQCVELELPGSRGRVPVELFGRAEFPPVGRRPYMLTLGPHSFYWLALEARGAAERVEVRTSAELVAAGPWADLLREEGRETLERILPDYLEGRRWCSVNGRAIKTAAIADVLPVPGSSAQVALVRVDYSDATSQTYVLPLAFTGADGREEHRRIPPEAVVARIAGGPDGAGVLHDAAVDPDFRAALLDAVAGRRRLKGTVGEASAATTRSLRGALRAGAAPPSAVLDLEQTNTSLLYGDRLVLKLLRRVEEGVNPDAEVGRFLTERAGFAHTPALLGTLQYRARPRGPEVTLAVLHGFVPNQGDAWRYTLDWLSRYFERALSRVQQIGPPEIPAESLHELAQREPPSKVIDWMGTYLDSARLLGRRTAELHLALASAPDEPGFEPEPFSPLYQRSLYQSWRTLAGQTFRLLRERLDKLPAAVQEEARAVASLEQRLLRRFRAILEGRMGGRRIRCHGDYRLGQILYTGKDFFIIDFEGESVRPMGERRIKRSPLLDVAAMLRSFHYASYAALPGYGLRSVARPEDLPVLEPWARWWCAWTCAAFWDSYTRTIAPGKLLPASREEAALLLDGLVLERAVFEMGAELINRPAWLKIPLQAIRQQVGDHE